MPDYIDPAIGIPLAIALWVLYGMQTYRANREVTDE